MARTPLAGRPDVAAIPLGRMLPSASCNLPGRLGRKLPEDCPSRRPYSVLLPVGFTVPLPLPVARWALTPPFHPCPADAGRFAFCGTFPGVAPAGCYPAPCFLGARTFLARRLSTIARAAARPA